MKKKLPIFAKSDGQAKYMAAYGTMGSSLLLTLSNRRLQVFKTSLKLFIRIQLAFSTESTK